MVSLIVGEPALADYSLLLLSFYASWRLSNFERESDETDIALSNAVG